MLIEFGFIARLSLLPQCMVYAQRAGIPHCSSLFRFLALGRLLRPHCCRNHREYGLCQGSPGLVSRLSSYLVASCSNFYRRWLFIIEGAITIAVAFIAIWVLPNFPRTTSWLSEEEKELAAWRLEEDIGEDDWVDSEQQSFLYGAKLAFTDIKTWILVRTKRSNMRINTFITFADKSPSYGRCSSFSALSPPPP